MVDSVAEKIALFDVENTLVRESKDVSQYYYEAIRNAYGLAIDDIDISGYEGLTIQETVRGILAKNGLTNEEIDNKIEVFVNELPYAHYNVAGHDKVVVVDGAAELLKQLHKRSYLMGVASGQLERILRNMFERGSLNYDSYFKFGTYGDADERILKILETSVDVARKEYGADAHSVTFVSNSKRGLMAAHELGINAVGVITDRHSMEELRRFNLVHIAKSLKECGAFLR